MTTFFLIISIYIALNLAMLAFNPVRRAWGVFFTFCKDEVVMNLWTKVFKLSFDNAPWWKQVMVVVLYIILVAILLLTITLNIFIPFFTYRKAVYLHKHPENISTPGKPERYIPPRDQWGAKTEQNTVRFDRDLPFLPNIYDVIYVEDEYNPILNQYIQEHYEELKQKFAVKKIAFNYLPKLCQQPVSHEELQYMFPYLQRDATFVNDKLTIEDIKQHLCSGTIEGPALIHFFLMPEQTEYYEFSYCPLVPESEVPLNDQFEWYLRHVSFDPHRGEVLYAMSGAPNEEDTADFYFHHTDNDLMASKSTQDLTKEIQVRICELRKRGVQLHLIRELVEEQPTLSRLIVDKEYRIFLPDYNNMEIVMSPLPKAVYLLFLKHPEGIPFKQLKDFYSELLDIYKQISNRVIEDNIEKSIRDITDPTKNSINEKCTRIREAFLKQFDEIYARNYYVVGRRGEPKRIILPRKLVDLQAL